MSDVFPSSLIPWDTNQINHTVPNSDHQDDGWSVPGGVPEKPPVQYDNYMKNQDYRWIKALSERADDELRTGRSQFEFNAVGILDIIGGAYPHFGTANQILRIDGTLNHTITSPGTSQFLYLYADDSAVVSAGTNVLTASELINSTTVPTYSITKGGWYNGDDLLIFPFYIDSGGNLLEFFHDGKDYVEYTSDFNDVPATTISNNPTWDTKTLTIPDICTSARINTSWRWVNGNNNVSSIRPKDSSGSGKRVGQCDDTSEFSQNSLRVYTNNSQQIEIQNSGTSTDTMALQTEGFYLPKGI